MIWQQLVLLALAGAAGTLARFGLQGLVQLAAGASFPWGTFVVNIVGCLAFGVVWGLAQRQAISAEARTIILVGFMGAFTTFSSFIFESSAMLEQREYLYMAANLVGQNVIGIAAFLLGLAAGKAV